MEVGRVQESAAPAGTGREKQKTKRIHKLDIIKWKKGKINITKRYKKLKKKKHSTNKLKTKR